MVQVQGDPARHPAVRSRASRQVCMNQLESRLSCSRCYLPAYTCPVDTYLSFTSTSRFFFNVLRSCPVATYEYVAGNERLLAAFLPLQLATPPGFQAISHNP